MSQKIAIERVDHIGIRVRDLDRALNFYRVLGFVLLRRSEGQRYRDHTGTGQLWRKRTDLGFRPRSGL